MLRATLPSRGFTRSKLSPASAARKNASVVATERLKLAIRSLRAFTRTNSKMSGWSTRSTPMFAPRRRPPCLITEVAASKTPRNETGPEATPGLDLTESPAGRRRENEKPVPPPDWWITAIRLTASKMLSSESSIGSTKQAESCPSGVPAFISVGLLGRNSRRRSAPSKSSRVRATSPPKTDSASATAPATRRQRPSKSSSRRPAASRCR